MWVNKWRFFTLAREGLGGLKVKKNVKERIAVNGFPSHSYGTSLNCHMGSHSVLTCYPIQVNAPRLNTSQLAGTRFTYLGGMEG